MLLLSNVVVTIICLTKLPILFFRMDLNRENEFYAGRVVTADGRDCALVWIERRFLDEFARSLHVLLDGTFTIPPRMFYQLVTIHFIAYAHVTILIVSF